MPELRIKTAEDNGDLPKDNGRSFKALTLFDALKDTTVIKNYNEQFEKSLVSLVFSLRRPKNHGRKNFVFFLIT